MTFLAKGNITTNITNSIATLLVTICVYGAAMQDVYACPSRDGQAKADSNDKAVSTLTQPSPNMSKVPEGKTKNIKLPTPDEVSEVRDIDDITPLMRLSLLIQSLQGSK